MRTSTSILLVAALLLAAGCDRLQPAANAAAGASPPLPAAVGPVPGPGDVRNPRANPFGEDAVAVQEGRHLFVQMNCSGCHGGRAGGGMGPSLRDRDWLYGSRDDQVFATIAEGRANGMPAWGARLPADEIWKIVAYVKSLRTDREPDKPESFP